MPALEAELNAPRRDDLPVVQGFCRSMVTLADAALAKGSATVL